MKKRSKKLLPVRARVVATCALMRTILQSAGTVTHRCWLWAALAFVSLHAAHAQGKDPFPAYVADACQANPWIIPFDQGSAELRDFARKRLIELVTAWRMDGGPLLSSGRVDGTEERRFSGLAQRRLDAVAAALAGVGVPRNLLWERDDAGSEGFVQNQPGVSEPQNRIVLVVLPHGGEQCARKEAKARIDWLRRNCSVSYPKVDAKACDNALSRLD